jgi:hypothetical protein
MVATGEVGGSLRQRATGVVRATGCVLLGLVMLSAVDCDTPPVDKVGVCECQDYACQRLVVDRAAALAPESAITWDGQAFELIDASYVATPPRGSCSANVVELDESTWPEQSPPSVSQTIRIECQSASGIELWFGLGLGDTRELQVGTRGVLLEAWVPYEPPSWMVAGTLAVEESVGSAAPFPGVVTPDFRRVLWLVVTPVTGGTERPVIGATLRFVLTAANFHGYPDALCHGCFC